MILTELLRRIFDSEHQTWWLRGELDIRRPVHTHTYSMEERGEETAWLSQFRRGDPLMAYKHRFRIIPANRLSFQTLTLPSRHVANPLFLIYKLIQVAIRCSARIEVVKADFSIDVDITSKRDVCKQVMNFEE